MIKTYLKPCKRKARKITRIWLKCSPDYHSPTSTFGFRIKQNHYHTEKYTLNRMIRKYYTNIGYIDVLDDWWFLWIYWYSCIIMMKINDQNQIIFYLTMLSFVGYYSPIYFFMSGGMETCWLTGKMFWSSEVVRNWYNVSNGCILAWGSLLKHEPIRI